MKNKKTIFFIILTILVIGIAGTFAYYTSTADFENVFAAAKWNIDSKEVFESPENWKPGDVTQKEITVKNNSNIPARVRVLLTEEWKDKNGNLLPLIHEGEEVAIINFTNSNDWIKCGDYYYYVNDLLEGEETSSIIGSVTFNENYKGDITCVTLNDGHGKKCSSSLNSYDGGTYSLKAKIETVQKDAYESMWDTSTCDFTDERDELYTVYLDTDGAIAPIYKLYVNNGDTYEDVPTLSKDGYVFNGWYTDKTYTEKVEKTDIVNLTGNQTLYAKFVPTSELTYSVIFASSDNINCPLDSNTYQTIQNVNYGAVVNDTAIPNPECTGYSFNGWTASNNISLDTAKYGITSTPQTSWVNGNKGTYFKALSSLGEDITLTAGWTPTVYTVTLDNQSATTSGTGTIYEKYNTGWYSDNNATTSISTITIPTKSMYTFNGYYTGTNGSGTKVIENNGTINSNTNTTFVSDSSLYANWIAYKYTVAFASSDTTNCPLDNTIYATISNIEYGSLVKDTAIPNPTCTGYGFTGWTASGNINTSTAKYGVTSIPATSWVNKNTGTFFKNLSTTNNGIVTLTATWKKVTTVEYDANGGTFENNKLINNVGYDIFQTTITKYSHTSNVDDTGKQNSNYGNNWAEANITGTDRGDTSKAHVVTIPGASSITVDVYYNGDYSDWATVWAGSHPDYTAASNYSSGVSNGTKLGGYQYISTTVNGNSLTGIGHSTFTINEDKVTFGFISDSIGYGLGYGYYAMVSGTGKQIDTLSGTYEEPTKSGKTFVGWYNSSTPSEGDEFDLYSATDGSKAYAGWGYNIAFDGNGATGGNMDNKICFNDSDCTLPLNGFTKPKYTFVGWATSENGNKVYDNGQDVRNITPNGTITLYAVWKDATICEDNATITIANGTKCKRATAIHSSGDIVYGQCGTKGADLEPGDALDCDVNGDGVYNATTERFYYVSDLYNTNTQEWDDTTAVLIYYSNIDSYAQPTTSSTYGVTNSSDSNGYNYYGPSSNVLALLPTSGTYGQWKNVSLKIEQRQILTEMGTTTTVSGTLPTAFSYAGKAARLLTTQELLNGCGDGLTIEYSSGAGGYVIRGKITTCTFLLQNDADYWLETPVSSGTYGRYHIWGVQSYGSDYVAEYNSQFEHNVRPVIEIPKSQIAK